MKFLRRFSLPLTLLAGCSLLHSSKGGAGEARVLTQSEAALRSQHVANVKYELHLKLDGQSPEFQGEDVILFDWKEGQDDLRVDFKGGGIDSLVINGEARKIPKLRGDAMWIPAKELTAGPNRVEIRYHAAYSRTGAELYRFTDPEDGRTFVYTDFEPFDSHQLFPNFDQPDLKASYKIEAEVPADWKVVSSIRETSVEKLSDTRALWRFPESARFSTYLISLHAGPYEMWEESAGKIPMRLFARPSLAKYVNAKEWFDVSRRGLAFYGEYFGYAYPFGKYDQVLVPDFNAGAMENVAAVTFSEKFIRRGTPTRLERMDLADVILHEMAHMWFGDLVTMQWWNDLWLNESFASYMSSVALVNATEFTDAWNVFFTGFKQWGYWEDQLITTHPIEATVPDTDHAANTLDGITYGKGASVLKQLAYNLGEENFKKGLKIYFRKHAYGNTKLADFMGALEEASGRDLKGWTAEWLQTAGLNKIYLEFTCRAGRVANAALIQSAPQDLPTLRSHRTQVGLYRSGVKGLQLYKTLSVAYAGARTELAEMNNLACPDLAYPNLNDMDFVKVTLDPRSLQTAKTAMVRLNDNLGRAMLWQSLWDMVYDAELRGDAFVDIAVTQLKGEKDANILSSTSDWLTSRLVWWIPYGTPATDALYSTTVGKMEDFFWSEFAGSAPGSDRQKVFYDAAVAATESPKGLELLARGLKDPAATYHGFELDQERRWATVIALNMWNAPDAKAILEEERKRDPSNEGVEMAIQAEAAQPDSAVKKRWFNNITASDSPYPLAAKRAAMRTLFPRKQDNFRYEYADAFFAHLAKVHDTAPNEYLGRFTRSLVPSVCAVDKAERVERFLREHPDLNVVVSRQLRISRQESERCSRVRSLMAPQS